MPLIPEFKSFDDLVNRIVLQESPMTFSIDPEAEFTSADVSPRLYSAIPALKKAGITDPDKQLEVLDNVVARSTQMIGEYIDQLPGGIYPDDAKKFKVEVIRPIVYKSINSIIHELEDVEVPEKMSDVWNWTTRALYNSMIKKGKLSMKKTADGPATKVDPSVVDIDSAGDLTDDVPVVPDSPTIADVPDGDPVVTKSKGLDNNTVYDVDAAAAAELSGIHRSVSEFIEDDSTGQEIMDSLGHPSRMIFNTPEAGGGLGGSRAKLKSILNDLVTQGILMPQKSEEGEVVTVEPEPEEGALDDRDWARSELDKAYRAGQGGIQMA
jgi:hypothetical protein